MYLLYPEMFEGEDHRIEIDTSIGIYRGRTAADTGELMRHDPSNAHVLMDVDRDEFMGMFFEALEKLDESVNKEQ
jgi:inosine-uridine nucleoside N-ribohydrolase